MKQYHNIEEIEDIRVIRDRNTKTPRGFGFLRFKSLDNAKAFLEQNYPTIYLYGSESSNDDEQAAKVRVAFSREREDRSRNKVETEWMCHNCSFTNFAGRKLCYKCQTPFADMPQPSQAAQSQFANSGDSDASPNNAPSQFVLLRGLEPTVTEELLAKGVAKLYKPTSSVQQPTSQSSKKGAAKVASTTGDANLGAREGSLRRVLLIRDRRSNDSWRYGFAEFASVEDAQAAITRYNSFEKFTIASKPVLACYIHAGVFVPTFNMDPDSESFTFGAAANPALRLQYWDEAAYANELVINEPEQPAMNSADVAKSAADAAAAAAEKEGLLSKEEAEAKSKKRKTESKDANKQKKSTPSHLAFWSNRHAELHGTKGQANSDASTNTSNEASDINKIHTQSFADPNKMCCYLCSRQFKSVAEVNKHERLSALHRDNIANSEVVTKALAKLEKAGIKPQVGPSPDEDTSTAEYRDRARERRKAFGASKPNPTQKQSLNSTKNGPSKEPSPPPVAAPSKGASLLGKMGWSAGEGLGKAGSGVTAPIETNLYAAGVGLGAQGGKVGDALEEAGRATKNDYGAFVERAREKAKERFEKM